MSLSKRWAAESVGGPICQDKVPTTGLKAKATDASRTAGLKAKMPGRKFRLS